LVEPIPQLLLHKYTLAEQLLAELLHLALFPLDEIWSRVVIMGSNERFAQNIHLRMMNSALTFFNIPS
jgi:hypothetical protein